jgi:hypothetical protein
MSIRITGLVALAAALLLGSSQSQAGFIALPTTLNLLTPAGNYTTVGDKTFANWSYTPTGITPPPASSISVTALTAGGTTPPYGFELTGPFAAMANTVNSNDSTVQYTVTSSGAPITAVNLFANAATTGSGFAEVVESVFTNVGGTKGTFLGQIQVGTGSALTATLSLGAGYSSLYIVKDIQYDVFTTTGTASISVIDQTFTQGVVPEPASIAMLGLGLISVGGFALRRRMAK